MLVLARLLSDNPGGNLTPQQVEYASVIHSAGTDLLSVLSGLLDAAGSPPASPQAPAPETAGPGAGQRLLVVEDARGGMLTLLARGAVSGLPGEGPVDVVTAVTPAELANALAAGTPHCAAVDLGADPELVEAALGMLASDPAADPGKVPGAGRIPVLAHTRDSAAAARYSGGPAELVRTPGELRERISWHLSPAVRDAAAPDAAAPGTTDQDARAQAASAQRGTEPVSRTAASGRPAGGHGHDSALHGKKILVVDDDPRNVFAITSTLEYHGMTVLRSADGRAGIEQLRSEPDTDLVLMDLMMPEMDGYTAISKIREMPEFSDLPIIAVTAHTMTGELAGGVPGADACLPKPLDTDALLGRMASCLVS
jgi:CheY-like chemotaxis protein